jgi:hypothetical protein
MVNQCSRSGFPGHGLSVSCESRAGDGRVLHSVPPSTLRLTILVLRQSSGVAQAVVAEGGVDTELLVSALAGSGRGMGPAACSRDGRKAGCMPKSPKAPEVSFSKRAADAAGSGGGGGGGRGRGSLAMASTGARKAESRLWSMVAAKGQVTDTRRVRSGFGSAIWEAWWTRHRNSLRQPCLHVWARADVLYSAAPEAGAFAFSPDHGPRIHHSARQQSAATGLERATPSRQCAPLFYHRLHTPQWAGTDGV